MKQHNYLRKTMKTDTKSKEKYGSSKLKVTGNLPYLLFPIKPIFKVTFFGIFLNGYVKANRF